MKVFMLLLSLCVLPLSFAQASSQEQFWVVKIITAKQLFDPTDVTRYTVEPIKLILGDDTDNPLPTTFEIPFLVSDVFVKPNNLVLLKYDKDSDTDYDFLFLDVAADISNPFDNSLPFISVLSRYLGQALTDAQLAIPLHHSRTMLQIIKHDGKYLFRYSKYRYPETYLRALEYYLHMLLPHVDDFISLNNEIAFSLNNTPDGITLNYRNKSNRLNVFKHALTKTYPLNFKAISNHYKGVDDDAQ